VTEGVVTIEGTVARDSQKTAAEACSREVKGVRGIVNKITVEPAALPLEAWLTMPGIVRHFAQMNEQLRAKTQILRFSSPRYQSDVIKYLVSRLQCSKQRRRWKSKGGIGWHTFRHSYRSWMDDTGAPLTIQQELMRHASVTTTMNVYGKAMTDSKRQAHSKVVQMVLKEPKPVLEQQDLAIRA